MNMSEVGKIRSAGRHMAHFAELLADMGDLGGAKQAERDARKAQQMARRYDKPVKYRPAQEVRP